MKISALMAGVAAATLLASGAQAADLLLPTEPVPVYETSTFDFEGFYIGVQGGLVNPDLLGDSGFGLVGVVAGANFAVSDAILAGAEIQVNGYFGDDPLEVDGGDDEDNNGFYAYDVLAQGKLGFLVTDSLFAYGLAGVGFSSGDNESGDISPEDIENNTYWTAGLGAEFAVTDALSIRGEAAYIGNFDTDEGEDAGFGEEGNDGAGKFTVGLLWHFN